MKKNTIAISTACAVAIGALAILFISGNTSERTVVEGFLFLDEQPLANADLFFVADTDNSAATPPSYIGTANAGGYYEVRGGLPPGDYRVVVRACVPINNKLAEASRLEELDPAQQMIMAEARTGSSKQGTRPTPVTTRTGVQKSLPELYGSAARTLLRVRVPKEGLAEADLYLSSELCELIASAMPSRRRF